MEYFLQNGEIKFGTLKNYAKVLFWKSLRNLERNELNQSGNRSSFLGEHKNPKVFSKKNFFGTK